jgi:hypothetical protein
MHSSFCSENLKGRDNLADLGADGKIILQPILGRYGNSSLHHRVQNGSGAHSVTYPMGTRSSFPGDKVAGA